MTKFKWVALIVTAFLCGGLIALHAQSLPVILLTAPTGSTLTNCGTPTVPSFCAVTTGVYIWQNATTGWFLISPGVAAGVTQVTVCNAAGASCGTPLTGAVSLNIPKAVTVTVGNPTVAVAAPTATSTQGAVTATLQ